MFDEIKADDVRPKLGAWAPGSYICKCYNCERQFTGDKRALSCADCAYNNNWRLMDTAPQDGTWVMGFEKSEGQNTKYTPHVVMRWRTENTHRPAGWFTDGGHGYQVAEPICWRPLPIGPFDNANG